MSNYICGNTGTTALRCMVDTFCTLIDAVLHVISNYPFCGYKEINGSDVSKVVYRVFLFHSLNTHRCCVMERHELNVDCLHVERVRYEALGKVIRDVGK